MVKLMFLKQETRVFPRETKVFSIKKYRKTAIFYHSTHYRHEANIIQIIRAPISIGKKPGISSRNIAEGRYNDSQIASLITVFLMRSISVEELTGFREALLEMRVPVDLKRIQADRYRRYVRRRVKFTRSTSWYLFLFRSGSPGTEEPGYNVYQS